MDKIVFLTLLATAFGCSHNELTDTLSCHGHDVKQFPNITHVSHIDILNTSLTHLPNITSFPNLLSMTIEDNELIDCQEVINLKESASNIVITTDCDDKDEFCYASQNCINLCVNILSNHML